MGLTSTPPAALRGSNDLQSPVGSSGKERVAAISRPNSVALSWYHKTIAKCASLVY